MKFQKLLLKTYATFKTKGLFNISLVQNLYTSSYFLYKRYLEDPFHTLIKLYPELFKHGHILDIGANIGYNARLFSKVVSPGFQVFAFEPEKENFIQLKKNCSPFETIIPIRNAVGAKSGRGELWRNELHPGDHCVATKELKKNVSEIKTSSVPIVSTDSFVSERRVIPISFIKIDVQGYELPVCLGMKRTLETNPHAVIALEYSPNDLLKLGFDPLELLSFWKKRDYIGYELIRRGIQKTNQETLHSHAVKSGYSNILFKHSSNIMLGLLCFYNLSLKLSAL